MDIPKARFFDFLGKVMSLTSESINNSFKDSDSISDVWSPGFDGSLAASILKNWMIISITIQ